MDAVSNLVTKVWDGVCSATCATCRRDAGGAREGGGRRRRRSSHSLRQPLMYEHKLDGVCSRVVLFIPDAGSLLSNAVSAS